MASLVSSVRKVSDKIGGQRIEALAFAGRQNAAAAFCVPGQSLRFSIASRARLLA